MIMIDTDFSWTLRVYHNHLRHLRSIVFVVYFLRVALLSLISESVAVYFFASYLMEVCHV